MQWVAEFVVRALCAQWLVVGTAITAYALAARLLRGLPATLRWLGTLIAGLWLATVGFHVLAAFGQFTLLAAVVSVTLLVVSVIYTTPRLGSTLARDRRALHRLAQLFRHSPYRGIATVLFICAVPALLRPLLMPPMAWDTLTYHALKAGLWVQNAGALQMDAPGPWAIYGERWGGAELLMAWAMLPFHSDLLALASDSLQWPGVGFAVLLLARQLGAREPYASSAGAMVMAVPTMRLLVGAGYVEPALCLCFGAALTFGVHCLRRPTFGPFLFAIVACALCAGIKMTMLSTAMVIGSVITLRILAHPRAWLPRLGWVVFATGAAGATICPWMLSTYRHTGLPLSPLPVAVAGYTLGVAAPETEWYMTHPEIERFDWDIERSNLIEVVFGWSNPDKEHLHAPTLIPVAVAMIGLFILARRAPMSALFMLLAVVLTIVSYYDPRLAVVRRIWTVSSSRFLLPTLVLLIPLSVVWCRELPLPGRLYLRLLWIITFVLLLQMTMVGVSSVGIKAATLLALGVCVVVFVGRLFVGRASRGLKPVVGVVLVCFGLLLLQGVRTSLRSELMDFDFFLHPLPKYWVNAALALDDAEHPLRIAVTGGPIQAADNWFAASFLGSNLQNAVVYVSPIHDGTVPHFGLDDLNARISREGDPDAWLTRLEQQGITHVVSFAPTSTELTWMRERPDRFRQLYGTPTWGAFELAHSER